MKLAGVLLAMIGLSFVAIGTTTSAAGTEHVYDAPSIARVVGHAFVVAEASPALLSEPREWSASPAAVTRRTSTTWPRSDNATEAGGVLKGAIPDELPANLTEQLALTEARASGGTQIMANLADEPRLAAVYGEGEWVKMQSVLRGTDANTTVHWFKNLTTGLEVEFKFK